MSWPSNPRRGLGTLEDNAEHVAAWAGLGCILGRCAQSQAEASTASRGGLFYGEQVEFR